MTQVPNNNLRIQAGLDKLVTVTSNNRIPILSYFHGHFFEEKKNNGRVSTERNYLLFACKDKQINKSRKDIFLKEQHQVQLQSSAEMNSNIHLTLRQLPSDILLDSGTGLLQTFLSSAKTAFPWPGIRNTRRDK